MKRICMGLLTLLTVLMMTGALADTAVIDGGSADRVHLRAGASTRYDSMGLFFTGTVVETAAASGEWMQVTIGAQTGYMMSRYLTFGAAASAVSSRQPMGRVLTGRVNLRATPSLRGVVLAQMSLGEQVTLLGETHDNWYYVQYGSSVGYVMAKYVEQTSAGMSAVNPPVSEAEDFMAYRAVLQGSTTLLRVDDNTQVFLAEWRSDYVDAPVTMTQMALADVDGDGRREVLLMETVYGDEQGVVILDAQNGMVMACELSYRACESIKADGSFSYANSAAEGGFGHLLLTPAPVTLPIAETTLNARGSIVYHVNNAVCSEAAYRLAEDQQSAKPDVVWMPLTGNGADLLPIR